LVYVPFAPTFKLFYRKFVVRVSDTLIQICTVDIRIRKRTALTNLSFISATLLY